MAENQQSGTVKTDAGKEVKPVSPAIPDNAPDVNKKEEPTGASLLSVEQQEKLLGDLEPGEAGFIELNPDGTYKGVAKRGNPQPGQLAIKVVAIGRRRPDVLMTPSGSPLLETMNPDPVISGRPGEEREARRKREASKSSKKE